MSAAMKHFLQPLLGKQACDYRLRNVTTGELVCARIETAFESASRKRGLLGRQTFDPSSAFILAPCSAIHTVAMRFAIDVVFARRDGVVVQVRQAVKPWRITWASFAFAAIELLSGVSERGVIAAGDRLQVEPRS